MVATQAQLERVANLAKIKVTPRKLPTPPTEKGSPSLSMRHHFVARKAGLFTLFGQQSWLFWSKQRQAWAWHWLPPRKVQAHADG